MRLPVTMWIRAGDTVCSEAVAFLAQHGYRPNRVVDVSASRVEEADLAVLDKQLGPRLWKPDQAPPPGTTPRDWLSQHPDHLRLPIVLTPKGSVSGFRERAWMEFFDIGKSRM